MKKLFILFSAFILLIFTADKAFADLLNYEYSGNKVTYSPKIKKWGKSSNDSTAIVLTKKTTSDSAVIRSKKKKNKTAERVYKTTFYKEDGTFAFGTDADRIFLYDGKLVLLNEKELRYTEIKVKNKIFQEIFVSVYDMQRFFPNTYIVPVSSFVNGTTILRRTPFKREQALLVNNTNRSFKDYRFSPTTVKMSRLNGLFKVRQTGKIKYVKEGDIERVYPALIIRVRNNADGYNTTPDTYTTVYSQSRN